MQLLKTLHITLALISISGFSYRAWAMACRPRILDHPLTRKLPHVVDTLLLLSGVTLAWHFSYNPIHHPWLATKLGLLLCYIVLGALGLRYAPTRTGRIICCLAALACVVTMLLLARFKPLLYGA